MGKLKKGNRIYLTGGYDMEPKWLCGNLGYTGTVVCFIPGQNKDPAAVVKLENSITVEEVTGDIVVLELSYVGVDWKEEGVVHIELCDFVPEAKTWKERKQGKWVESNATYRVV